MAKVDIIIPTYNNAAELRQCIDGFERQSYQDIRLIICVDGSSDHTLTLLSERNWLLDHLVLEHPDKRNHGRNPARNLALNHISAEFVLLHDSDLVPLENLIHNHLALVNAQECISVGEVDYRNKEQNPWARYLLTRGKNQYDHLAILPFYYMGIQNVMLKADLYLAIGGVNADMHYYGGNDNDLSVRLKRASKAVFIYNKQALSIGTLAKTLPEALNQLTEFGTHNLPYLVHTYREYANLFGYRLFRRYRFFFNLLLKLVPVQSLVRIAMRRRMPLENHLIRFLVALSIFRGIMQNRYQSTDG
jgi:glycosyltransferase involved in cell wall biosynthesis